MAAVIHSLWEKGDRNPLIMPANMAIDDPGVQFALTRYLSDNWVPVIERDVDGSNSQPLRIDGEVQNLGKYAACRRVARTIYLGSAPTTTAAHHGIEDRRVKLGCVMPGETPAVFGDALLRLAAAGTYLYQDGPRYWYSTQPTVTKLAEDRAEQLLRDPDKVAQELERRLRADLRKMGDFSRVHPLLHGGQDVPDDPEARLVVLSPDHPYSKEPGNVSEVAARAILESRGNAPRLCRNALVFLAADKTRLQDLDEAVRRYLAWESILAEKEQLDLAPNQVKQAETQKAQADGAVTVRLPETYQWLLVPEQKAPDAKITWQAARLTGQDALAARASKKLRSDEMLVTSFVGSRLRLELERVPLWRGDHVSVKQLVEDFARYPYLPRLKDSVVLLRAVEEGVAVLTWELDGFAFADSFDELTGRYRGLRAGQRVELVDADTPALLVKPDRAKRQLDAERAQSSQGAAGGAAVSVGPAGGTVSAGPSAGGVLGGGQAVGPGEGSSGQIQSNEHASSQPKRFHGTVSLDPTRVGRDAGQIAEEVIAHFAGLVGAKVTITLEVEAEVPSGVPEQVVRTVTENSRTLKFTNHGFEKE